MTKFQKTITAILAIAILILLVFAIHKTRDEKILDCLRLPSDKGVEYCLTWLLSKEPKVAQ